MEGTGFSFEQLIEKALTTDDGLSKMKELIAMQQEAQGRQAKSSFFAAKAKMQAALPVIKKTKKNDQTHSFFASLDDVTIQISPVLEQFGFSFAWDQRIQDGMISVKCVLTHVDGHQESNTLIAPADVAGPQGKANKTPVQGAGSTVTFLRRYTLTGVVGVATADKDIDGRIGPVTHRQEQKMVGITNSNTLNALAAPKVNTQDVMDNLLASVNIKDLNEAGKLINHLPIEEQDEVKSTYFSMREQFEEVRV